MENDDPLVPIILVGNKVDKALDLASHEAVLSDDINVGTVWLTDAEKELKKIPFFVRGKARRNTETYAIAQGVKQISVETLYEAKAHYAR